MEDYKKELWDTRKKLTEREFLDKTLKNLEEGKLELMERMKGFEEARDKEQRDVEQLEGSTLRKFFLEKFGNYEEKMDKERIEAYAALVKYEAARKEYVDHLYRIEEVTKKIDELSSVETKYNALLNLQIEWINQNKPELASQISELEDKIKENLFYQKELQEAIDAGKEARKVIDKALEELLEAQKWGNVDIFIGGGAITHIEKHTHLDNAQLVLERIQIYLKRFNRELTDINMDIADLDVRVEGFTRFADYLFDNIFTDICVQNHIDSSIEMVVGCGKDIEVAVAKLIEMREEAEGYFSNLKKKKEKLLLS